MSYSFAIALIDSDPDHVDSVLARLCEDYSIGVVPYSVSR